MRFLTTFAAVAALGASTFAAAPPVPRPATPLEISDPSGSHYQLSNYKGKVVVVQFLFTTCPHCQAYSALLSKLQTEYGPRGFQAFGVAFNEEANANTIRAYQAQNHVNFPIGVAAPTPTPRDTVLNFMKFSAIMRLVVPQVALIDRKGVIIEQTEQDPQNAAPLQEEPHLRAAIEKALGPASGPATTKKAPAAPKKADTSKKPAS